MSKTRDEILYVDPPPGRETLEFSKLRTMMPEACDRIGKRIDVAGVRKNWVGIGWTDEGPAQGDEIIIVENGKMPVTGKVRVWVVKLDERGYFSTKKPWTPVPREKATWLGRVDAERVRHSLAKPRVGYREALIEELVVDAPAPRLKDARRIEPLIGFRVGWLDSIRWPSRVHRTINGKTTYCGHPFAENIASGRWAWPSIGTQVPTTRAGRSHNCKTCFRGVKVTPPWMPRDSPGETA